MKPERRLPVTPLTLEVVRDLAHLEHIKSEWSRFVLGLERVTPFQLPEWQLAWWRHFGAGRLHVMLFRNMDSLVGIVPCYISEGPDRKIMALIGSGIAGYLEPPIAPAHRAEVANLLKGHLLGNAGWDVCDWRDVEGNSPLASLQLGDKFDLKAMPDGQWSEVLIQGTFQQYWEGRSFALRRNFLKYLDKAAFADRPRFEIVNQADPEFVNAMIRMQGEQADSFAQAKDGAAAFLADLARVLDNADMLQIFGLRFNRKIVAVLFAFMYRNTLYGFAGGHDPEFEAQGFGRLLLFETLRHAFERGFRSWNFLRGNEPYKLLWGAQMRPTARTVIERKGDAPAQLQ
jgi:CelD/BcsL family acetyltransferase involved in cellulose biosynthesis